MALDAGYIQLEAALDLTGANSVSLGFALTNLDVVELGVLLITASGADTVAVRFRHQAPPTGSAGGTSLGTVTGPAATIVAAGKSVRKYLGGTRVAKGSRIWADVTDATTGATDARVYIKAYPAGEGGGESNDIASST